MSDRSESAAPRESAAPTEPPGRMPSATAVRTILRTVAVAPLAAAAALGWAGVFPLAAGVVPLAVAGAGGVVAAALLARTRLGPVAQGVVLLAAFAAVAAALAERRPPTPDTLGDMGRGLRDGWAQILDTHLPVEARGGPMTTAVAVVWVAGCLASVAHRVDRPGLHLVPPLVALTAGLAFGATGRQVPAGAAAAVVVAAVAAALVPTVGAGGRRRLGRVAASAAVVVAVVAAAGPAWPGASAREPYDLRQLRDQPVVLAEPDNPLARLGAAVSDPDDPELFRAAVSGAPDGWSRWRLAVLDRFDGNGWTASSTFRRLGAEILPPDVDVPTADVDQTITLAGGLEGPFLPAAGPPTAVEVADGVVVDDAGTVALRDGAVRPHRYRVRSAVPVVDPERLRSSRRAEVDRLLGIDDPTTAARFRSVVDQALDGAGRSDADRLAALQRWFTEHLRLAAPRGDQPVPTGNGLFQISRLFETGEGTAEQFASAFAVLAETQAFDARVVVGYRRGTPDPATGELVVRSRHAHAWPEVRFEGIGWVAYEPTPASPDTSVEPEPEEPPERPGAPAPGGTPTTTTASGASGGSGDDGEPAGGRPVDPAPSSAARVAVGVAAVAAVFTAAAGVLVAAKASRRRRQQRGSPAERVAGAWSAALDRLSEVGVAVPPHLAATEVATASRVPTGAMGPLSTLADVANACRYSAGPATDVEADMAWEASRAVAAELRSGRRPGFRLPAVLHPAPFLRR